MDPKKLFHDSRLGRQCSYCGGPSSTRDHVPSKVLLEEPFPDQLPVVKACEACNNGFSLDEEYLACLVACVLAGTTEPKNIERPKIRRLLTQKPALAALINSSRSVDGSLILWKPDEKRVKNVLLKLARGHAAFENAESYTHEPVAVSFLPLSNLSAAQRADFEAPLRCGVWPEIGSRAFQRAVVAGSDVYPDSGWQVVQPGRYRYMMALDAGVVIRMVLSEYLGAEVIWG